MFDGWILLKTTLKTVVSQVQTQDWLLFQQFFWTEKQLFTKNLKKSLNISKTCMQESLLEYILLMLINKMKFSFKDIFRKFDQIRIKLRVLYHLLKESLMENFIICVVYVERSTSLRCLHILWKSSVSLEKNWVGSTQWPTK